jgi:hypothetical protein
MYGEADYRLGDRVDEVAEDVLEFDGGVAAAELLAKQAIQAAGHQGELQIAIDLYGDRGGQRVDMEEVCAVDDTVRKGEALGRSGAMAIQARAVGRCERRSFPSQWWACATDRSNY